MPGPSDTQTTVQKSEPWAQQIPYLVGDPKKGIPGLFPEANRLYQLPGPRYYQGQTVADMSPERAAALAAQAARAQSGSPLMAASAAGLARRWAAPISTQTRICRARSTLLPAA